MWPIFLRLATKKFLETSQLMSGIIVPSGTSKLFLGFPMFSLPNFLQKPISLISLWYHQPTRLNYSWRENLTWTESNWQHKSSQLDDQWKWTFNLYPHSIPILAPVPFFTPHSKLGGGERSLRSLGLVPYRCWGSTSMFLQVTLSGPLRAPAFIASSRPKQQVIYHCVSIMMYGNTQKKSQRFKLMRVKQCHKPAMTGNGLYAPPIKMVMTGGWCVYGSQFYPHYSMWFYPFLGIGTAPRVVHPSCGNGHCKPVVAFQGEARQCDVRFTNGERLGCFGRCFFQ